MNYSPIIQPQISYINSGLKKIKQNSQIKSPIARNLSPLGQSPLIGCGIQKQLFPEELPLNCQQATLMYDDLSFNNNPVFRTDELKKHQSIV